MPDCYLELLDATIQHLQSLKASGHSWTTISPAILAQLDAPPVIARTQPQRRTPATAPAPAAATEPIEATETTPSQIHRSAAAKQEAFAELKSRTLLCQKCPHLVRSRKNVVFGVGDINSPLMFVGEAPGADEDVQGEPFVGAAGQLLTKIIKAMGFTRETVYIANVLKCRPDTPGQSYGNRKPTPEEMRTCLPYLLEQIRILQPKVLVALGATAMEGLFGRAVPISKVRGHWQSFQGTPVMPTYHPSFLLRNQAMAVKREVWEDMLQVLEKLGAPVTEKQRNYFRN